MAGWTLGDLTSALIFLLFTLVLSVPVQLLPSLSAHADITLPVSSKSPDVIPKSLDKEMDRIGPKSNGHVEPGISVANGPVEEMDVDAPETNGVNGSIHNKRKSRSSIVSKSYKEASDSEDDEKPLVRQPLFYDNPYVFVR